jgi:hypothetical protein
MAKQGNSTARRGSIDHQADAAVVETRPRANPDLGWDDETTSVDIVMPMAELMAAAR